MRPEDVRRSGGRANGPTGDGGRKNRRPISRSARPSAVGVHIAKLEDTTRDRYEDLVRLYVGPALGDLPAGKLDAELLESFYARLQRCRDLCDGRRRARHECRPLSGSTVRKIHYVISAALEQAVRWRHLGVNPAALAIAPSANHTEPDPPSAEEAAAVIGAAWGDPDWGSLLWVMMVSGMRRGEISALRWRHVDFATDTLIVQRANAQPKSGVKEKQTKTRQQRRIAIDPQTAALLRAHRERWEQRCRLLGVAFQRRHVRLLSGAGRIITVRATLSEPPLPPAGDQARAAQHTPALAAPLLRRPSSSPPASTCVRSPGASATGAGARRRSRCTRDGSTKQTAERRQRWRGSCPCQ